MLVFTKHFLEKMNYKRYQRKVDNCFIWWLSIQPLNEWPKVRGSKRKIVIFQIVRSLNGCLTLTNLTPDWISLKLKEQNFSWYVFKPQNHKKYFEIMPIVCGPILQKWLFLSILVKNKNILNHLNIEKSSDYWRQ